MLFELRLIRDEAQQTSWEYGQTGKEYTDTNHLWGLKSHGEKERRPDSKGKRWSYT